MSAAAAGTALWREPAHWCGAVAFALVVLAETGRQPVDNPDTHLELTMIHEGPLLEYAGRDLALLQWAARRDTGSCSCSPPSSSCRIRAVRVRSSRRSPSALLVLVRGARASSRPRRRRCGSSACRGCSARRRASRCSASSPGSRGRRDRRRSRRRWSRSASASSSCGDARSRSGWSRRSRWCSASPRSPRARRALGECRRPALALIVKAVALPALLLWSCARTREPRLVARGAAPAARVAGAAVAVALAPRGSSRRSASMTRAQSTRGRAGRARDRDRRRAPAASIFQLLGFLVAENGLYARRRSRARRAAGGDRARARSSTSRRRRRRRRVQRRSTASSAPATRGCWGACVTEPPTIAPARTAARGVGRRARRGRRAAGGRAERRRARCDCRGALALAALAVAGRMSRHRDWYVVDAAGGVVPRRDRGRRAVSALASPAYLRRSGRGSCAAARPRRAYYAAFHAFWAALLAVPLADNLALAWLLVEATTGRLGAAGRVQRQAAARSRPAGSTSCSRRSGSRSRCSGSSCSRSARPGGDALLALDWRSIARRRRCPHGRAVALRADPRRARDQDRLGARAQLATRRTQRGAAAGQRAAVGGAVAVRRARRLARAGRARPRGRCRRRQRAVPGLRTASLASPCRSSGARCRGSGCWPTPASSTWACSRSGSASPHRWPPPASWRMSPATRSRSRSASTPRCRCCGHDPGRSRGRRAAGRSRPARHAVGVRLGALAGLPPSPLFSRAADPARRPGGG